MYLSKISIKDFRLFSGSVEVSFSKGLNLLVGENGSGKSSVIDAIRALLGENEFSRRGIVEEDFYSVFFESQKKPSDSLLISGIFSDLTEAQKVEYLTWLNEEFNAKLSFEVQRTLIRVLARAIQRAFFTKEKHGNSNILYKPEDLEASQWNSIIVSVQKRLLSDSSITDLNKTWLDWKKALASCLGNIAVIKSHGLELKSIRPKMGNQLVLKTFSDSIDCDTSISIETIHGCKGMSLDSVLFVSSYRKSDSSSGSHWRDWFQHNEAGLSEAQRLAYVAFSRAKHLLTLGISNPPTSPMNETDKKVLTDYGFEIVEIAEDGGYTSTN